MIFAMGIEIERKFLVRDKGWRAGMLDSRMLRQGYLAIDCGTSVRVRTDGSNATVTIKGPVDGLVRPEFEYAIPAADAEELLGLCCGRLVEKMRHRVEADGRIWEVDEFLGANAGLVLAEAEMSDAREKVALPEWLGAEVSSDPRYLNANLGTRPFRSWENVRIDSAVKTPRCPPSDPSSISR